VPALCNLWADEKHVAENVEVKLIEAAIKVCSKQGRESLLATIESTNAKVRGELEELGFEPTAMTTSEKFVYRDAEGRKRRGSHENVVLLKKL
jgi:L-amino acid N-acyltransferase YncA